MAEIRQQVSFQIHRTPDGKRRLHMTHRFSIATLKALAQAPADIAANWLVSGEDSVAFLKTNAQWP